MFNSFDSGDHQMIYTSIISLLIEKLFDLLRPQSFSFQMVSYFIDIFVKFSNLVHFTIVTIGLPVQNLKSLPGQRCQFLLPAFYQYFTIGTKYIIILPMNYHYFTSQNQLHKITSIYQSHW